MDEQIHCEHWDLGAHATIDAMNMVALNFLKEKRSECIEHICIYLLCTCDTTFHAGVGGGDIHMLSVEHYCTCNGLGFFTYK